ncbi:MAG: hypothetical protein AAGH90_09740 [Pseudomonadota bacterium]
MTHRLAAIFATITLSACGGSSTGGSGSTAADASACPPKLVNPNSLSVSGRYEGGIEAIMDWNKWRTSLPPRDCAGSLGPIIPELPEGFGVAPSNTPPIMSDDQVYISYGRMPANLEPGPDAIAPPMPLDGDQIDIEIVRWSKEEVESFERYIKLKREGSDYLRYNLNGQTVYSIAGPGYFPLSDRMMRGLVMSYGPEIRVKVFHKDIYKTRNDIFAEPSVFKTVLESMQ